MQQARPLRHRCDASCQHPPTHHPCSYETCFNRRPPIDSPQTLTSAHRSSLCKKRVEYPHLIHSTTSQQESIPVKHAKYRTHTHTRTKPTSNDAKPVQLLKMPLGDTPSSTSETMRALVPYEPRTKQRWRAQNRPKAAPPYHGSISAAMRRAAVPSTPLRSARPKLHGEQSAGAVRPLQPEI